MAVGREPRLQQRWLQGATLLNPISCVVYASSFLPLFDSGVHAVLPPSTSRLTSGLLRWDAFHFAHIAEEGYVYEYEWAFFPGAPLAMRYAGGVIGLFTGGEGWANALLGGALLALLCDSTGVFYDLSTEVFGSNKIAYLATLLSLMPSSPATLRYAPYTEPFFSYLSYKGMLASIRSRYIQATAFFMLASTFRSNGVFLAGYLIWPLLAVPILRRDKPRGASVLYATCLAAFIFTPFISHQYFAYRLFCPSESPPSWCSTFPPSIYTYVQSTYWDVGFLRYWQVAQIPNFLMAAPVYALLLFFCWYHLSHRIPEMAKALLAGSEVPAVDGRLDPFLSPKLTPFVIHALVLTTTLLVSSHVQIMLRLAPSMPVVYWAAASLLHRLESNAASRRMCWGKAWVWWSVTWGTVSVVLWTTGLPPA
ncbi:mannosyltransferase [Gloeophyllum trabeum ATCC 11539]|uniref:GPI mannosyltransferase 2 n=1 Tax=Gloeophyllum trabeum (strain ATCC 11539 / FP-39264 / Madison 617) TaxID=670483 RepID=S7QPL3_GLOTA|nr:mannosyltransferase [Gloeophyllum trabeum ATCC 11539]EPQ61292.1 mannosyltransferase [Gloeophyllum trabeum ATCC 11539]